MRNAKGFNVAAYFLSNYFNAVRICFWQYSGKLFPTITRHRVRRSFKGVFQLVRHRFKAIIAAGMAEAVTRKTKAKTETASAKGDIETATTS